MPRRVVPISLDPSRRSLAPSRSRWYGMIRCALHEISRRCVVRPSASSRSISSSSTFGSMTTPLPMTGVMCGYMIPLGIRCSLSVRPPWTIVCPALLPPWKRTTKSMSSARRSVILPLPSSPHWAPTRTMPAMVGRLLLVIGPADSSLPLPGRVLRHPRRAQRAISCAGSARRAQYDGRDAPAPPTRYGALEWWSVRSPAVASMNRRTARRVARSMRAWTDGGIRAQSSGSRLSSAGPQQEVVLREATVTDRVLPRVQRVSEVRERASRSPARGGGDRASHLERSRTSADAVGLK